MKIISFIQKPELSWLVDFSPFQNVKQIFVEAQLQRLRGPNVKILLETTI